MKVLTIPVNARSGQVAEAVLGTFLKRDLRPGGTAHAKGFVAFDTIQTEEVERRPQAAVAIQEVVRDESVLRTFAILTHLYTEAECVASDEAAS